jgi:hypothetical protein
VRTWQSCRPPRSNIQPNPSVIAGSLFLKETKHTLIWDEVG